MKSIRKANMKFTDQDIALAVFGYSEKAEEELTRNQVEVALQFYNRARDMVDYLPLTDETLMTTTVLESKIGLCLLMLGDYCTGFKYFEARNKLPVIKEGLEDYRAHTAEWTGEDISGKRILVVGEQGFGDVIQFVRYLPLLKDLGATVLLQVRKPLVPLMKTLPYIDEVYELPFYDRIKGVMFDTWIKIMSIPSVLEVIPTQTPYIYPDPVKVDEWGTAISRKAFNVGICWGAFFHLGIDAMERSIPLKMFKSFCVNDKIDFYSLQKWNFPKLGKPPKGLRLLDHTDKLESFAETAALVENLDLVITVDTAVAHLAGAMNKLVWVLLPYRADWRWQLYSTNTTWYKSMTLFRQKSPGDWPGAIYDAARQLKLLVDLYGG